MVKVYIHLLIRLIALFQLFNSDSESKKITRVLKLNANTQTDLSHNPFEEFVYYKVEFKENLVEICSLIYEGTLKDDELEEGFPIDRATQTKCSGVYMRNFATFIDYIGLLIY